MPGSPVLEIVAEVLCCVEDVVDQSDRVRPTGREANSTIARTPSRSMTAATTFSQIAATVLVPMVGAFRQVVGEANTGGAEPGEARAFRGVDVWPGGKFRQVR